MNQLNEVSFFFACALHISLEKDAQAQSNVHLLQYEIHAKEIQPAISF